MKNMNKKNRFESCREINAKGYKFKGKAPAASCPKCGGWSSYGGVSQNFSSPTLELGRLGCEVACGSIDKATEMELEKTFDFFKKLNEYNRDTETNFSNHFDD